MEKAIITVEQDTHEAALPGKLGRSESAVQQAFARIDHLALATLGAVDRRAIRSGGEWVGRSYLMDRKMVLRIDPKIAFLRVWIGEAAYTAAPPALKGSYQQDEWLVVRPADLPAALVYLEGVLQLHGAKS